MVSANRVVEFIASDNYQKNLQKINLLTSIEVQGEYSDAHSIITQKKMMAAQVEIVDIEECLTKLSGVAASYTMRKHKATYDLDESIGISGESENTRCEKYSQGYLINNLIEILLARRGKKDLEAYLKSIKVQGAKSYATQIIKWLNHE